MISKQKEEEGRRKKKKGRRGMKKGERRRGKEERRKMMKEIGGETREERIEKGEEGGIREKEEETGI